MLFCYLCSIFPFFFSRSRTHRDLHSFPTRRSSDLCVEQNIRGPGTRPAWIAFRSAMSLKPHEATLRTVVKPASPRSEEHTSELQSLRHLVCRLLLEKKKKTKKTQP